MSQTATMTATELLRAEHRQVTRMFDELLAADQRGRVELFDCLRATLAVHETAEEMTIHPTAKTLSEHAREVVAARLAEEQEAKQLLADLEKLTPAGDGFGVQLTRFRQAVLNHADAEERELFPLLEESCDADQLRSMADAIRTAEKLAPTHPHPHGPESAIGNLLIGPFVAMVDKVRDKLAQR